MAPPAEPEAAQQSGQVCGDIVVRVVYSTVASTQWFQETDQRYHTDGPIQL